MTTKIDDESEQHWVHPFSFVVAVVVAALP